MNYYKKIDLDCSNQIKQFCLDYIKDTVPNPFNLETLLTFKVEFPTEVFNVLQDELTNRYNFPKIWYNRVYMRPKQNIQVIHVDGSVEIIHCAVNIPLFGGKDSFHSWYKGKYNTTKYFDKRTSQVFHLINWESNPELIESIELIDDCYLVRVDEPHSARSSNDSDRWVLTIRFEGNPTFEELYNLIQ